MRLRERPKINIDLYTGFFINNICAVSRSFFPQRKLDLSSETLLPTLFKIFCRLLQKVQQLTQLETVRKQSELTELNIRKGYYYRKPSDKPTYSRLIIIRNEKTAFVPKTANFKESGLHSALSRKNTFRIRPYYFFSGRTLLKSVPFKLYGRTFCPSGTLN
jgi:hypothetical protein